MSRKNIPSFQISKNNRNTLQFLRETQKYINKICNPSTLENYERLPEIFEKRKKLVENKSQVLKNIRESKKSSFLSPDCKIFLWKEKKNSFQSPKVKKNEIFRMINKNRKRRIETKNSVRKMVYNPDAFFFERKHHESEL